MHEVFSESIWFYWEQSSEQPFSGPDRFCRLNSAFWHAAHGTAIELQIVTIWRTLFLLWTRTSKVHESLSRVVKKISSSKCTKTSRKHTITVRARLDGLSMDIPSLSNQILHSDTSFRPSVKFLRWQSLIRNVSSWTDISMHKTCSLVSLLHLDMSFFFASQSTSIEMGLHTPISSWQA